MSLNLPQLTSSTADKEQFLDDLFTLIDKSVTNAVAIDASASTVIALAQIANFIKVVAMKTPQAGTTLTLPAMSKMLILGNDKAALGPVTYSVGTATIVLQPGGRCIAHLDGTVNGLEVVTASAGATSLSALTDVDESTAPTQGQYLGWDDTAKKWRPMTLPAGTGSGSSTGSGSGSGGTTTSGPHVVQSAVAPGNNTAVLPAAPTIGNMLVCIAFHYHGGDALPTGFTELFTSNHSYDGVTMSYCMVTQGVSGNVQCGTNDPYSVGVWEVAGVKAAGALTTEAMNTNAGGTITALSGGIVLGAAATTEVADDYAPPGAPANTTKDASAHGTGQRTLTLFHVTGLTGSQAFVPVWDRNSDDYTCLVSLAAA